MHLLWGELCIGGRSNGILLILEVDRLLMGVFDLKRFHLELALHITIITVKWTPKYRWNYPFCCRVANVV